MKMKNMMITKAKKKNDHDKKKKINKKMMKTHNKMKNTMNTNDKKKTKGTIIII